MKTLKSHTEQVIHKYDERFTKHECDDTCFTDYGCSNIRTLCDDIDCDTLRDFVVTSLKELSDLQAEETRVEKKETGRCPECTSGGACRWCRENRVGHNSAVEQQEKLSNAFRNL